MGVAPVDQNLNRRCAHVHPGLPGAGRAEPRRPYAQPPAPARRAGAAGAGVGRHGRGLHQGHRAVRDPAPDGAAPLRLSARDGRGSARRHRRRAGPRRHHKEDPGRVGKPDRGWQHAAEQMEAFARFSVGEILRVRRVGCGGGGSCGE